MGRKERTKKAAMLATEFGQRLRKVREERLLSQRELGGAIGIETSQISRYERGVVMPNAETLIALADALRIGIAKLLVGHDEEPTAAEAPIEDISLLERFRDLSKLDRRDREMVIGVIDAVIASRQHELVTRRRPVRRAS